MAYELTGTIKLISDVQTFASGFSKQEFVVTTDEKYPQDIKLEAVKDNTEQLAKLDVGDTVTVAFDVRGNEYKDRYYVNLVAWKITAMGSRQERRYEQPARPAVLADDDGAGDQIPF